MANVINKNNNKRVKNLLRAKNIKKLTKFNKPDILKVENITRSIFFTTKARLTFT